MWKILNELVNLKLKQVEINHLNTKESDVTTYPAAISENLNAYRTLPT